MSNAESMIGNPVSHFRKMILATFFGAMTVAGLGAADVRYIDDANLLKSITENVTKMTAEGNLKSAKSLLDACKAGKAKVDLCKVATIKMEPAETYEKLCSKVLVHCVTYKCGKCNKLHVGCSTTFAIAKDVIVFNAHAIGTRGEDEYHAVSDREGHVYAVTEVLKVDKDNDIVIARVAGADFEPFALKADEPVGSSIYVMSNPDSMFYVMTQGSISRYYLASCDCGGKKCKAGKGNRLSITADYAKGSSGAPVLDINGNVVGLVSTTSSIYYNEKDGKHDNLQMVVKSCVPASSILNLTEVPESGSDSRK